jgi:hypothetical protein
MAAAGIHALNDLAEVSFAANRKLVLLFMGFFVG